MTSINYQYNIISSNCIGGWYYRLMGLPFQNPFIWDTMKLSDFIKLIKNFDNINFENIKTDISNLNNVKNNCSHLILDDSINVYFTHHNLGANEGIRKLNSDIDVESKDILKYIEDCWLRRYKRMKEAKSEPIFVYWDALYLTDVPLNCLLDIKNQKTIIITENITSKISTKNTLWFKKSTTDTKRLTNELISFFGKNKNLFM